MRHTIALVIAIAGCCIAPQFTTPSWSQTATSCGSPIDADGGGWASTSLAEAALDATKLCALNEKLEKSPNWNVHAVLIVRGNRLVYETYRAGEDRRWGTKLGVVSYTSEMQHDVRSISKSVVSLLVGIALDRKLIASIDEPVFSFFPEYAALRTPESDEIQLRHLLTMTSGIAWKEALLWTDPRNTERLMGESSEPYRYVLEQKLEREPGTNWEYNGGNTMLLSAVLQQTTGKSLFEFAKEALFAPLGITNVSWTNLDASGEPAAHGGLRLRPRDMAKIGQLMLNRGKWNGRQIVPEKWIDDSTQPLNDASSSYHYGYQWWVGDSKIGERYVNWIAGWGLGGQRIYVVPEYDLVVVITSGMYSQDNQDSIVLYIFEKYVLAGVVD